MSKTTDMIFLFTVLWLLCGPLLVLGITVSPDSGKRNKTGEEIFEEILLNKTNETNESMTDRNRRLIPYMTFYMPNDFSSNQHYNYIPEQQQKQMIALYQSYQPPRNRIEQQQQQQPQPQQQHQQQQQFQIRYPYPTQKPKYQGILYGNRHQLSNQGKDPNHHQRIPISFKESNAVKAGAVYQHPSTTKVNVNPFVPSNKLPGHFKPIIYIHQTDNVDYSRYPQSDPATLQQYNDVLSEQQNNYQHDENQGVQSPVHTTPSSNLPTMLLPSSRPLYPLVNDVQQEQHHQQHQPEHVQHQSEASQNLTPQQKYVEYLREQLRYKQQQYYQQQPKQAFIINSSPPPQVGGNVISYESPENIPVNQIVYQSQMGPTGGDSNESYNSSPSPRPIMYNHPSSSQSFDYNNNYSPSSPRPPAHNYPDYLEVIVQDSQQQQKQQQQQQEEQQVVSITPEKQTGFKQVTFVTTASPIMLSSVSPIYNNHQTSERFRINKFAKPIQSSTPVEGPISIDLKQLVYIPPQIKYKPEMRPTYIPQPTSAPQIIRQHLTETTQVPPPTLTTYHPNYVTSKPNYNSPISRPSIIHGSYKPKITQKLKPIIVTKPTSQALVHHKQQKVNSVQNESFTNITENSLTDILHKLQDSNQLPKTFTADNIDNSIRTLIKILNNLKQSQTIVENPPQHHEEDYDDYDDMPPLLDPSHPSPNSGRPGIDYPVFAEIPRTSFNCKEQRYKGFFGDPETNCQVWHYCDLNGGQASFLCPNGTIFSQVALTCDWWFNVKCSSTAQLYVLNERLYKYILPLTPKFPEDYSGPLVDKYLALKFKEMEDKMRREKTKGKMKSEEDEEEDEEETADDDEEDTVQSTTKNSENIENKIQDPGDENDNSIVTTTPSLQSMPIIVSSTEESFLPTLSSPKISVESEKVEVIEIKTDGNSGHLIPPQVFNSGLKK